MHLINVAEAPLNLEGFVKISKVFDDGSTSVIFEDKNLITNVGKQVVLNQLYYSFGAGDPLAIAKVGTGGAEDGNGVFLKSPTVDLTDLYSPVYSVPIILTGSNPTVPQITLMANVDNSQANGYYLNEAGFFTASNKMFNIKVFPRVLKKSSFALNLEWVIRV